MKITAKGFRFWLLGRFFILSASLIPCSAPAQGTLNALNVSPIGGANIGYANQGVGWSFVPTSDILVTAINSTAPQVDFWLGTNQNIASYFYEGPYFSGQSVATFAVATNFQAITPLFLLAGQTYFISTQQTNFSSAINLLVYSLNGTNGMLPFTPSASISQFASFLLSDGQWTSPGNPASENANYAILGPNFQFQVVPEPAGVRLIILALSVLVLFRSKQE